VRCKWLQLSEMVGVVQTPTHHHEWRPSSLEKYGSTIHQETERSAWSLGRPTETCLDIAEPANGPRRSECCLLARGRRFCELCFVALLICELSIAYIRDAPSALELHEKGRRCRVVVNSVSDVNLLFSWPRVT